MLEVVDGMRPGMSATVEIITEQRNQTLSIPIQSLTTPRKSEKKSESKASFTVELDSNESRPVTNNKRSNKKRTVVFVVNENIVEQRFVEVGIVGDRDYEVLSGLEEGEEIVIGGFVAISRDLYDGAAVTIKKQSENSYKRGGGRPGSGN